MIDDRVHLRHIADCLAAIQSYTAGGQETFFNDRKTQKATIRELQELAESSQRLSAETKGRRPEIPWKDIGGFRNVLVHDYLGLNLSRIWSIIERDLPPLRTAVEAMLVGLEGECEDG
jgi:uncharacterized protein with HEPN domain